MANRTLALVRTMAGPSSSLIAAAVVSIVLALPTAPAGAEPEGRTGATTKKAAGPTAILEHHQNGGFRNIEAQKGAGQKGTNTTVAPPEQLTSALGHESAQLERQAASQTPESWWRADWPSTISTVAAIVGALGAVASVFLGLAILFVYLGQLIAMNRQVDYLRDTLAETQRTAAAAMASARIAEATLQITQRAQLAVIYFEFGPHKKTRVPTAVFQLHNSGHLHGTITGRTVSFMRGEPLPADPVDGPTEWMDVSAVAAPGRAVQILASFEHVSLTHAEWRSVVIGSLPLTVYGAIRYETGFPGVVGETGFAFTYDPDAVNVPENRRFSMANESGYNYSR